MVLDVTTVLLVITASHSSPDMIAKSVSVMEILMSMIQRAATLTTASARSV